VVAFNLEEEESSVVGVSEDKEEAEEADEEE
jgi:hypothetical protein